MTAAQDTLQIGRFIYATSRLEFELTLLLRLMGQPEAEPAELAANARAAQALFGLLPADDDVQRTFTALMDTIGIFGEQRDGIFARIADMGAEELASHNENIAAASQQVRHFHALAEAMVPGSEEKT
ncbi:MAG: hypothetical protein H7335_00895 [Massilia sp.]|nr:hypothetical protein [Massilia sp.]